MNRFFWTVTQCTILLVIICNLNTMKATSANSRTHGATSTAKPAASTPPKAAATSTIKPTVTTKPSPAKPAASNTAKPAASTPKKPHDERAVLAAAAVPIVLGVIGEVIGFILQYIAS
ncbi:MEG-14 [Schistosoma mansoni]|uniref:MEG-14 n=1 Tax=Schistosoma mansoni TaxID=6183 RepID=UPI0001A6410F|nr:MEG-14 [Schistosoma mansoni]|eukprot:XP_018647677.1 MEG-14 [Schistosoma mansoni]